MENPTDTENKGAAQSLTLSDFLDEFRDIVISAEKHDGHHTARTLSRVMDYFERFRWHPIVSAPIRQAVVVCRNGNTGCGWRNEAGVWFVYGTSIRMETPEFWHPFLSNNEMRSETNE
jgi:hypothetical protein